MYCIAKLQRADKPLYQYSHNKGNTFYPPPQRLFSRPYWRSRLCYVFHPSVYLHRLSATLPMTLCIVAKRCVLEQKLLLTAYRKSYMRNRLVSKWMTLTLL